jgi:hypothetical protein
VIDNRRVDVPRYCSRWRRVVERRVADLVDALIFDSSAIDDSGPIGVGRSTNRRKVSRTKMTAIVRTAWVCVVLGVLGLRTLAYNRPGCPGQCECVGANVDCSYRGLATVPKLPTTAEKV